jgi:hypothetical protein
MNEKRRIDSRSRISKLRPPGSLSQHLMHFIVPLLLKNPGLSMIGLDTESNQAVLVSGKEGQSLTLNEIREIAEGRTR